MIPYQSYTHIKKYVICLKKRGPQRSVDVIVSAAFIVTLLLLAFLSVEWLKDSVHLHSHLNLEALMWSTTIGIFLVRFMTLGNKIHHKYRSVSVLITEQINLYLQVFSISFITKLFSTCVFFKSLIFQISPPHLNLNLKRRLNRNLRKKTSSWCPTAYSNWLLICLRNWNHLSKYLGLAPIPICSPQ